MTAKITKKEIRAAISEPYRSGYAPFNLFGFTARKVRQYKPRGLPGYAWSPRLVIERIVDVPDRTDGPFNWNGTMSEAVDMLHKKLNT
jgi:hypothetical protein